MKCKTEEEVERPSAELYSWPLTGLSLYDAAPHRWPLVSHGRLMAKSIGGSGGVFVLNL